MCRWSTRPGLLTRLVTSRTGRARSRRRLVGISGLRTHHPPRERPSVNPDGVQHASRVPQDWPRLAYHRARNGSSQQAAARRWREDSGGSGCCLCCSEVGGCGGGEQRRGRSRSDAGAHLCRVESQGVSGDDRRTNSTACERNPTSNLDGRFPIWNHLSATPGNGGNFRGSPRRDGHRVSLKEKFHQLLEEDHGDRPYHYRRCRLAAQPSRGS